MDPLDVFAVTPILFFFKGNIHFFLVIQWMIQKLAIVFYKELEGTNPNPPGISIFFKSMLFSMNSEHSLKAQGSKLKKWDSVYHFLHRSVADTFVQYDMGLYLWPCGVILEITTLVNVVWIVFAQPNLVVL